MVEQQKSTIVRFDKPYDYLKLEDDINLLCTRYKFLNRHVLGKSYLGKNINLLTVGTGEKKSVYIGAHHGMEWITALLLMRFIENCFRCYTDGVNLLNYNLDYIFESRTMYIIPMLNPDGVDLALNGADEHNPVRERLIAMNGGSDDFSSWQANARGVDLNHNYDAGWDILREIEIGEGIDGPSPTRYGGEYPESEYETQCLASFIRAEEDISLLIALHSQGEEIYWRYGDYDPPKAKDLARAFRKSTGYKLSEPNENIASHGGCKDWFISAFNRPAFTFECGKGQNPLPLSNAMKIYNTIEEALILGAVL